jgi:hypothetical protein
MMYSSMHMFILMHTLVYTIILTSVQHNAPTYLLMCTKVSTNAHTSTQNCALICKEVQINAYWCIQRCVLICTYECSSIHKYTQMCTKVLNVLN